MPYYLRKRRRLILTPPIRCGYTCGPMTGGPEPGDAWSGVGTGWGITSTFLAGILVLGGLGYLVDRLIGTGRVFMAIGMIAGAAVAIYLVYLRYGKGDGADR